MLVKKIHHVAYRCINAKQTVEWYDKHLGMKFVLAIAEDEVPSTNAPDPYMHVFIDAGMGNILAFFELPNSLPMDRDHNTPAWTQHIAFEVASMEDLLTAKQRLEAAGIEVIGVTAKSTQGVRGAQVQNLVANGHATAKGFGAARPAKHAKR